MNTVQQAIEVSAPLHTVFEQLATFESYPRFMTGVEQVIQVSSNETRWIMDLDGQRREFDAQIIECSLDERVAWSTMSGPRLAETITLRPVGETRTQVVAQLEADAALMPHDQHAQDSLNRRLKQDLAGLKRLIEHERAASDRQLSGTGTILGGGGAASKPMRPAASPADVAARARRNRSAGATAAGDAAAGDAAAGDAAAGSAAPDPGGIGDAGSTRRGLPTGTHMGAAAMGHQAMSGDDAWGDGMVNEEERGSAHDL